MQDIVVRHAHAELRGLAGVIAGFHHEPESLALVNTCAVLTILVGTPLAGLAFESRSGGGLAFAAIAVLAASALLVLRRARL